MFFSNLKYDLQLNWTKKTDPSKKEQLLNDILKLSKRNLGVVTKEYLEHRYNKYDILIMAYQKDTLVGFMFSHFYKVKVGFIEFPLVHVGLTVVEKEYRKKNVAGHLSYGIYLAVKSQMKWQAWSFGLALTSKCSSPISYIKIQNASLHTGLPKIKNKNSLGHFSRSFLGQWISKTITKTIADQDKNNYLLENANPGEDFLLEKEKYVARNPFEQKVFDYFQKNIIPHNELIFASWVHPIFLLWW